MNLEAAAQSVYTKMNDGSKQFDPAAIIAILELIIEFLPKLFEICDETYSSASGACREMTVGGGRPFRRLIARWQIRRFLGADVFREMGTEALDSMLVVGSGLSPDDWESLHSECGS